MKHTSTEYDKFPYVQVEPTDERCVSGWDSIASKLKDTTGVLTIDCYPGVDVSAVKHELGTRLKPSLVIDTTELFRPDEEIKKLVGKFLGGDDRVFGYLSDLELPAFFNSETIAQAQQTILNQSGLVLVLGVGASLVHPGDLKIYADLARWEAQMRFRRNESDNLGAHNRDEEWPLQYKRAYFIDWRVADRWKIDLLRNCDYLLDTNDPTTAKLVEAEAIRTGLEACLTRPFRVVPFFDPAPWGGQWMKKTFNLDQETQNFGWCFDCVPEENSLMLGFGDTKVEIPSIDLVLLHPQELLGDTIFKRFGAEFPIRFDFLDTIEGGNLSFQVHPTTEYIRQAFGMDYTQDESYYILDAEPDASVYLGLTDSANPDEMFSALETAQKGGEPFQAEQFSNRWPAAKHDHFLIPAGTVHCSGTGAMVLEISATPYIFTFKLWDWGRNGLDGKPRPINIEHGKKVIDWSRKTEWTKENLINQVSIVSVGEGWIEERTGLHELEFIETRRHWFTQIVHHDTEGTVNVLNLVQGKAAIVESPTHKFEPYIVRYAETFIVPASVGSYTIRPLEENPDVPLATIKAFVRR
jgi:mannose-6-phosphate isomerase class I